MGRKPRLHIEGGLYHIIARGNNRKEIFRDKEDFVRYLTILRNLKEKTKFKLYAYCLMPNHFHLLAEVGKVNTSDIMQRLLTAYTKYYNRKYKKVGHLFQGRYKSLICEKEGYLLELLRYIHLNPCRAGLTKSPSGWEWSGHREYLQGANVDGKLIDVKEVLGIFSDKAEKAVDLYENFVKDGGEIENSKKYYPKNNLPYVGSDSFIEDLASKHEDLEIERLSEKREDVRETLKAILSKAVGGNKALERSVIEGARDSVTSKTRAHFILEALENGYKGKDISGYINCSECYITKVRNSNK